MKPISALIAGRETVVVERDASVLDAARIMSEKHIGAVPVLHDGRLVGIFTERDVMSRVVAAARHPGFTKVGDVMSTDLVVANIQDPPELCLQRMQQTHVRHLIVLDEGRLAGIVSLRDLLTVELAERDDAINLLSAYVHYIPADLGR
jgi:CBS domain-containing protein